MKVFTNDTAYLHRLSEKRRFAIHLRHDWSRIGKAMMFVLVLLASPAMADSWISPENQEAAIRNDHRLLTEIPSLAFDEIEEQILEIDEAVTELPLSTGQTYAVAIALPAGRNWTGLLIYSYPQWSFPGRNGTFFPEVEILDEQKQYVRTFPAKDFVFDKENVDEPKRLLAYVELNTDPKAERYLVIHTSREALLLQRTLKEKRLFGINFDSGYPTIGKSDEYSIRGQATGQIKLKVYKPFRIDDELSQP